MSDWRNSWFTIKRFYCHTSWIYSLTHRVGKFGDFFEKNQKNRFFWFKSDFFYLNQIFLIFFKICCIYTENWTILNRNKKIMIILLIFYPYFPFCGLIFILVDFYLEHRLAFYLWTASVFAENCTKIPMFWHIWLNFL